MGCACKTCTKQCRQCEDTHRIRKLVNEWTAMHRGIVYIGCEIYCYKAHKSNKNDIYRESETHTQESHPSNNRHNCGYNSSFVRFSIFFEVACIAIRATNNCASNSLRVTLILSSTTRLASFAVRSCKSLHVWSNIVLMSSPSCKSRFLRSSKHPNQCQYITKKSSNQEWTGLPF